MVRADATPLVPINGGPGTDTVDFSPAVSGVTVSLTTGEWSGGSSGSRLASWENVYGSSFPDTITGDDNDNVLNGNAGDDTIDGLGGVDTCVGEVLTNCEQ